MLSLVFRREHHTLYNIPCRSPCLVKYPGPLTSELNHGEKGEPCNVWPNLLTVHLLLSFELNHGEKRGPCKCLAQYVEALRQLSMGNYVRCWSDLLDLGGKLSSVARIFHGVGPALPLALHIRALLASGNSALCVPKAVIRFHQGDAGQTG